MTFLVFTHHMLTDNASKILIPRVAIPCNTPAEENICMSWCVNHLMQFVSSNCKILSKRKMAALPFLLSFDIPITQTLHE